MINELDNRIKLISDISPIPENEQKLREELQLLYMIADKLVDNHSRKQECISDSVRHFARARLTELENAQFMQAEDLQKKRYDLNTLLLRTFKKLDKEGRRISFSAKPDKISVLANEKAIRVLFERLMCFCKSRISVEIKENRIKIKSDCSFPELYEMRNNKSDLMNVINKVLSFHSSTIFFSTDESECEISLSLNGMLCNETD